MHQTVRSIDSSLVRTYCKYMLLFVAHKILIVAGNHFGKC